MRMYFLTLYNLSPIQQGIQCGHAALEYVSKYKNQEYVWDFINNHKTWIILNGWTSLSILDHIKFLENNNIEHATFQEPDLWWITTAVAFIADETSELARYFTPIN